MGDLCMELPHEVPAASLVDDLADDILAWITGLRPFHASTALPAASFDGKPTRVIKIALRDDGAPAPGGRAAEEPGGGKARRRRGAPAP
jgi:hypothetical protein